MKKYLPIILFVVGILIVVLVFVFIKNKKTDNVTDDNGTLVELAFPDRSFASLTPTIDGHYINLKIEKIKVPKAVSMDYELLYSLPDGRAQGVPGTAELKDIIVFERKLLLGSESNGKFRYDEGVEEGNLTVRFRDSKGKLLAKFSTKFHLQSNEAELTSVDTNFTYTLDKKPKGIYFITMETFGLPASSSVSSVTSGPYAVFASAELPSGSAEGWQTVDSNLFYK
ncbi:MAG: hypothetical protein UR39_C0001G0173 [Candidatus Woesebacteria bacterium GW2011_GWA1_33_30]|uniref:Uncharacterized protein n=1 Tax=Candidatus Woesebacteria bacterium GW2011_GWA2_33_28 TaxID=1618561 RepID=A0A0F9ZVB6_9BACT|nr:MAG: hypothetical protein UR38_C0001G0174 [Candidatus Woesebacteria bacterium GW2011_GWA2_33_28]KKP49140.1 MAG: hypothetical protein UR39_C0001G0173 [Candidatus Woesebacteria bacterium GW2011_GWA1_33_30]KKP50260.1 MAG: hypothetical protein UR40_C0001G0002 [Microgenomates group bacterium GW2011_GWC1_33_32]KKP52731.1 MAG: hypothetical protein UR44_C0001G0173 [Candidatus Woesebacteria bacterium GW2011_GWB1_33_38]KKP56585.1 MAG: hypothetical protein UR48_C0033G0009 [Microgenomates group bacteriu